jgi:hypothetical protein
VQFGRPSAKPQPPPATKPKRAKAPKLKNDPKLVAAARELRDRWLEQVNAGSVVAQALGRYDVGRELPAASTTASVKRTPLLEAA